MGPHGFTIIDSNGTIAGLFIASRPKPAMRRFVYFLKKAFFKCSAISSVVTFNAFIRSMIYGTIADGTSFGRIFWHLKISPLGVIPPAAITARRFFCV